MSHLTVTAYNQVQTFHKMFGYSRSDTYLSDIYTISPKLMNNRLSFIMSEIDELYDAMSKNDFVECVDAICDIRYFVLGTFDVVGYNFDTAEKSVYCVYRNIQHNNPKIFEEHYEYLQKEMTLLDELSISLTYANNFNDLKLAINALIKMEAMTNTLASLFGIDLEVAFREVHRSNMTKACYSETEANETINAYLASKTHSYTPIYEKQTTESGQLLWIVKNSTDKKILKSINFENPDLKKVLHYR